MTGTQETTTHEKAHQNARVPRGSPWRRVELALVETARGVRHAFDRALGDVDLNLSQASLLVFLRDFGPHTQTQLAERMSLGRAATGSCIDHLEGRGFVVRNPNPEDRRVWLVSCTDAGTEMAARVVDIDRVLQARLRTGITKAERQQLAELLLKIQTNLDQVEAVTQPRINGTHS